MRPEYSLLLSALILTAWSPVRGQTCSSAEIVVGHASGSPGEQIDVDVLGAVSCETSAFSFAVGHDMTRVLALDATPGQFLIDHAGPDLAFYFVDGNDSGYAAIAAFFDLSPPLTIRPTSIAPGTVLATVTYEILPAATSGVTPLLNRTRTYGEDVPIANVYARSPGVPVEATLVDGSVSISLSEARFIRGDSNADSDVTFLDPIRLLRHLYYGLELPCEKSADFDDDGVLRGLDVILGLWFVFYVVPFPASPFPGCGPDSTPDSLVCEEYPACA